MKKKLLLAASLIFALLIFSIPCVFAQDSARAKLPAKTVAKPVTAVPGGVRGAVTKPVYHAPRPYQRTVVKPPLQTQPAPAQPGVYAETPISTDKSLNGQYQYVLSKTYHYQQPMIAALWKNINDSLNATKKVLKQTQAKLAAQTQSITSLQNDVKTKDETLTEANSRRDEISILGIYLSKTAYNFIMWGLVVGLALVLLIIILRTSGAVREAKYRTQLYEELNEEFTAYKAKAGDKEKKLARELQTERNRVDELMGRG